MDEAGTAARSAILGPLQGHQTTLRAIARRRGLSYWWVAELARSGRVPGAVKVSNRWTVHADVAEAWLSGWWDPDQEDWAVFAARHGLTETRWV